MTERVRLACVGWPSGSKTADFAHFAHLQAKEDVAPLRRRPVARIIFLGLCKIQLFIVSTDQADLDSVGRGVDV